jgi:hypothetical protein
LNANRTMDNVQKHNSCIVYFSLMSQTIYSSEGLDDIELETIWNEAVMT